MSKRFATAASGNTYNALSDFPETGCGFGVNTQALTLYAGFVIPEYSRICFMNYGGSPDAAISAVSQSGEIYSAFRSSGTWKNGKVSASKDDLENLFRNDGFYFTYSKADDFTNILEELNVTDAVYIARKANAAVFGREMTSGGKYYGSQLKIDHNTGLTFRKWAGVSKGNFGDWITK